MNGCNFLVHDGKTTLTLLLAWKYTGKCKFQFENHVFNTFFSFSSCNIYHHIQPHEILFNNDSKGEDNIVIANLLLKYWNVFKRYHTFYNFPTSTCSANTKTFNNIGTSCDSVLVFNSSIIILEFNYIHYTRYCELLPMSISIVLYIVIGFEKKC